ncbi:hypothetical protein AGMMS49944_13690 [Spirochaetia bacterium]|nr:hypothetical protein AGMMS49944_13690 [Spirochaetia bacterium]
MLLTFQGYFEAGKFTPDEPVSLLGRKKAIVTILDDEAQKINEQTKAWEEFFEAIESSDEEIPDEFPRFNISRTADL